MSTTQTSNTRNTNNITGSMHSLPKENMYQLSAEQWSPFAGCRHGCSYCKPSFQAQAKRHKHTCMDCYDFTPHKHPTRLKKSLKRTGFMQFIFTCSMGDVAFCDTDYLQQIAARMSELGDRTFLLQSKNPATFNRIDWPKNVVLGMTMETNRDELAKAVAPGAPVPSKRHADFIEVSHNQKMVTIEPVMDFDLDVMVELVTSIDPCMVWLGYDSKKCGLPEPPLSKVQDLYWELGLRGIVVVLKKIRPGRI